MFVNWNSIKIKGGVSREKKNWFNPQYFLYWSLQCGCSVAIRLCSCIVDAFMCGVHLSLFIPSFGVSGRLAS